ncbi:hypothetical protein BgAZ_201160 [Babesia gibsoni]|uniref:protein-disulfide reductase n=1 Tax=Babesia gibsoni TaxID=33632 RepID=A0AAD8LIA7_BABGI|nr:hypothetical protein BgAZ_201160 [Babesia gibsoni]
MAEASTVNSTLNDVPIRNVSLYNQRGEAVPTEELKGMSVGLLFCNGTNPSCLSILPFLIQYYKSVNGGSPLKKIEIVYISCDGTKESFDRNVKRMPWLHLAHDDAMNSVLKRRYNVTDVEGNYGCSSAMEIPSIVVIDHLGVEIQRFPLYHGREESNQLLRRWDWRSSTFP